MFTQRAITTLIPGFPTINEQRQRRTCASSCCRQIQSQCSVFYALSNAFAVLETSCFFNKRKARCAKRVSLVCILMEISNFCCVLFFHYNYIDRFQFGLISSGTFVFHIALYLQHSHIHLVSYAYDN